MNRVTIKEFATLEAAARECEASLLRTAALRKQLGLDASAEAAKLRAENAALRERLRRIREAIPSKGDDVDPSSGEALHHYSRVSETTVSRVEDLADLRRWRVLHKKGGGRHG